MIKNILERIFLGIVFMLVFGVFVGIAYELQLAHDPTTYAQKMLFQSGSVVRRVLFSPDDDIKTVLIGLIEQEKKRIALAVFTITDKDIAQALIDAHQRKVIVELVTDRGTMVSEYSKMPLLMKAGIAVYSYPKVKDMDKARQSLMHNKFILFYSSLQGKMLLWTGSFNLSRAASYSNQENVIVLDDAALISPYVQRFSLLKEGSDLVAGKPRFNAEEKEVPIFSFLTWLKQLISLPA
jgi:phosphatidylserine/phosphatidylglycerophosphate/cardiolipin synthase-like enzyme